MDLDREMWSSLRFVLKLMGFLTKYVGMQGRDELRVAQGFVYCNNGVGLRGGVLENPKGEQQQSTFLDSMKEW